MACCQGLVVFYGSGRFSPRRESGFEFSSLECCKPKIEIDMFKYQILRDVLFWHVRGSNPKRSPLLPFLRSGQKFVLTVLDICSILQILTFIHKVLKFLGSHSWPELQNKVFPYKREPLPKKSRWIS